MLTPLFFARFHKRRNYKSEFLKKIYVAPLDASADRRTFGALLCRYCGFRVSGSTLVLCFLSLMLFPSVMCGNFRHFFSFHTPFRVHFSAYFHHPSGRWQARLSTHAYRMRILVPAARCCAIFASSGCSRWGSAVFLTWA